MDPGGVVPISKDEPSSAVLEQQPQAGELMRAIWLFWGSAALGLTGAVVSKGAPWTLSWVDALFWAVAVSMFLARFFDVTRFGGRTAEGKPATMRDFRMYAAKLLLVAGGMWAAAQSVQL
jgi:hypothetical protein